MATVKTIGLIGAGHIGSQLARLAVRNGYDVVVSNSRGPETLQDLVRELGPRARAGTPMQAAEAGDVVVVTIPLKNIGDVPAAPLAGKIVIDTNNYYPQRDGPRSSIASRRRPRNCCSGICPKRRWSRRSTTSMPRRSPLKGNLLARRTAARWPSPATTRKPIAPLPS